MLAWAAGLYEGEGNAPRCGGYLRLAVKMTNEEAVRPTGASHWIWVALRDDALSVADDLRPWLSAGTRAQLERVLRPEI